MLELAEDRRCFGFPRLHELLRREGLVQNHKPKLEEFRAKNIPYTVWKIAMLQWRTHGSEGQEGSLANS
ncbi:hypothetical protein ACUZ9P_01960 [Desulfovibrio sp. QI0430]